MNCTEEQIARLVHEANRTLQAGHGDDAPSLPWDCETEHVRATCLDGVRRALAGETPEQHHEGWCEWKRRHGWVYGPVKDAEKRTHPCLVPYGELPRYQQVKDIVLLAVVRAMAEG